MFSFVAPLWLYPGESAWYFITVPRNISDEIRSVFGGVAKGFGSIPVQVTIGSTIWRTSLFPDSKEGCYLLPIKVAVRKSQKLEVGQDVEVQIEVGV